MEQLQVLDKNWLEAHNPKWVDFWAKSLFTMYCSHIQIKNKGLQNTKQLQVFPKVQLSVDHFNSNINLCEIFRSVKKHHYGDTWEECVCLLLDLKSIWEPVKDQNILDHSAIHSVIGN